MFAPDYDALPLTVDEFTFRMKGLRVLARVLRNLAPLCPAWGALFWWLFGSPVWVTVGGSVGAFCFAFDLLLLKLSLRVAVVDMRRTYRALLRDGLLAEAAELLEHFPFADPAVPFLENPDAD